MRSLGDFDAVRQGFISLHQKKKKKIHRRGRRATKVRGLAGITRKDKTSSWFSTESPDDVCNAQIPVAELLLYLDYIQTHYCSSSG